MIFQLLPVRANADEFQPLKSDRLAVGTWNLKDDDGFPLMRNTPDRRGKGEFMHDKTEVRPESQNRFDRTSSHLRTGKRSPQRHVNLDLNCG